MSERLPIRADPWRLCDLGRGFRGALPLAELKRLKGLLCDSNGTAEFDLRFCRDEARRMCVTGRVNAVVRVTCQRCLVPMDLELVCAVSLAVVESLNEVERLPDRYEPLLVQDGGTIEPAAIIEDEIILALPLVAMHVPGECTSVTAVPTAPADV
jgi:uncharacterized protein